MKIESVKTNKKNRELAVITLEDGSRLNATSEEVVRLGLRAGAELGHDAAEHLAASRTQKDARKTALNVLSYKPYSKKGLEARLVQKGIEPGRAAEAVTWLEDIGLINDSEYARLVVETYSKRGLGASRIRQEMTKRGIDREMAEESTDGLDSDAAIDKFLASKLKGKTPDRDDVRRLTAALARRGHRYEDISRGIRRCSADYDDCDDAF